MTDLAPPISLPDSPAKPLPPTPSSAHPAAAALPTAVAPTPPPHDAPAPPPPVTHAPPPAIISAPEPAPPPAVDVHAAAAPPPSVDSHHTAPPAEDVPSHLANVPPEKHRTAPDHPSTDPHAAEAPTASIDPNVPSSESAPTALPTNPAAHPTEQKEALKDTHPEVVHRQVEKTKAASRELKGEAPKGTIVNGVEDDRLYAMLRRFDVQITHVLHPATHLPPAEPDLRPSTLPNLPSHSDVLKANLERLIAAIGPSSVRGAREAQRLMSWEPQERKRTGIFCAAYFTCWIFGYAVAGVLSFFVAIFCFPQCRRWFFPPVAPAPFTPVSATDPTNQKGDESLLGNVDNKAVHRSKHEQAEEQAFEATSILQAYTARLIFDGSKRGKQAGNANVGEKKRESDTSSSEDERDGVTRKSMKEDDAAQGHQSAEIVVGGEKIQPDKPVSEKEKTKLAQKEAKRKRDEMVSKMIKTTEGVLGDLADFIERMANALSPPSCYPDRYARFKMAGAFFVAPMFLFTFVPPWIFTRSATFFFGVGMWGQPLLIRAANKFVELVPDWQEKLDMRNSLMSGVPTDQQLTLHLLRVAEALENPLPRPPPPPLAGTPKEAIKDTTPAAMTAEDDAELLEAEEEGGVAEAATKVKHKTKSHVLGVFQRAGKKMAGFHGDVSVDGAKKQVGSEHEDRKGAIGTKIDKLLFRGNIKDDGSINSYPAKLDGTSGHIVLEGRHDGLAQPHVSFVPLSGTKEEFVLPIDDIVEIKKSHVSMTRIALGWASGADVEGLGLTLRFKSVDQQISENMRISEKTEGRTMHFTRVGRREQLFVRLVSMGRQRWEVL